MEEASAPPVSSDGAVRLRALAHSLRWKLIDLLGSEGSATATRCSQVLGDSVASCAYHLGILAKYGYVEPVPDTAGREKPWRLTDRNQDLSPAGPDPEAALGSEAATEAFIEHEAERIKARQRAKAREAPEWAEATALGGSTMWMTASELAKVTDELTGLLRRHQERWDDPATRPPGAREVRVFFSTSVRPES